MKVVLKIIRKIRKLQIHGRKLIMKQQLAILEVYFTNSKYLKPRKKSFREKLH